MRVRLCSVFALSYLFALPTWAGTYAFTDLGAMPEDNSFISGVNNQGVVVGTVVNLEANRSDGFYFMNGQRYLVPSPLGSQSSMVMGISNTNVLVGSVWNANSQPTPFVWTTSGAATPFQLAGATNVTLEGISDDGSSVVGNSSLGAFVHQNGTTYFDPVYLGPAWRRVGLSNAGEAVGYWHPLDDNAYYWNPPLAGGQIFFPLEQQPAVSYAEAINNNGRIVGFSYDIGLVNGFVISGDGTGYQHLAPFIGNELQAHDINDLNVVVGWSGDSERHAFLWTESGGYTDLNTLLPLGSGWLLTEANAINERGDIAGIGYFDGERRGFLLTAIPEPASLVLLGMPLAMLVFGRRRGGTRGLISKHEDTKTRRHEGGLGRRGGLLIAGWGK